VKWIAFISLFVVTGFMSYWLGLFEAVHHAEDGDISAGQKEDSAVHPKST
jgi:hypothetical protein